MFYGPHSDILFVHEAGVKQIVNAFRMMLLTETLSCIISQEEQAAYPIG